MIERVQIIQMRHEQLEHAETGRVAGSQCVSLMLYGVSIYFVISHLRDSHIPHSVKNPTRSRPCCLIF